MDSLISQFHHPYFNWLLHNKSTLWIGLHAAFALSRTPTDWVDVAPQFFQVFRSRTWKTHIEAIENDELSSFNIFYLFKK